MRPVPLEGVITYLYVISYIMYTSARVAKPGQRRQVQGLISQEFLGSNPIPRIIMVSFAFFITGNISSKLIIYGAFNQKSIGIFLHTCSCAKKITNKVKNFW